MRKELKEFSSWMAYAIMTGLVVSGIIWYINAVHMADKNMEAYAASLTEYQEYEIFNGIGDDIDTLLIYDNKIEAYFEGELMATFIETEEGFYDCDGATYELCPVIQYYNNDATTDIEVELYNYDSQWYTVWDDELPTDTNFVFMYEDGDVTNYGPVFYGHLN